MTLSPVTLCAVARARQQDTHAGKNARRAAHGTGGEVQMCLTKWAQIRRTLLAKAHSIHGLTPD
eukprot:3860034-Rhodomonas_salina.1